MNEIKFYIEKPADVTVSILNMLGFEIENVSCGYLQPGEHNIPKKPYYVYSGDVLKYRLLLNGELNREELFVAA